MSESEDTQSFVCPRCGSGVVERFWGPCSACRQALVASFRTEAAGTDEVVASARFEPSMHVVPNHVATKD